MMLQPTTTRPRTAIRGGTHRRLGSTVHPLTLATRPLASLAVFVGATVLSIPESAYAEVYLNELVIRGTERAELYNSGPAPVLLTGWKLAGDLGDFLIPDDTTIAVGEYLAFDDLGDIFHDIGGEGALIDDLKLTRDVVAYGQVGGAPSPHDSGGVSLCRAPDAALGPPLGPTDNALYWTLDLTSTFGASNDAPNPDLGSSVLINELGTTTPSVRFVNDSIELYNPTGAAIILGGWYATFGAGPTYFLTSTFIPPSGVVVEKLPPSIDLDTTQLAYLFTDLHVRVDQLGWSGSFASEGESCIGRCPDGAGPNDGFNGNSSGGGTSLFFTLCTLGQLNGGCNPTPVDRVSWGQVKGAYR